MTPIALAENLAKSDQYDSRVLGAAIMTRGLTDGDPATLRQGWPLDVETARSAAKYVGIHNITEQFLEDVVAKAPTLSDAILNKS